MLGEVVYPGKHTKLVNSLYSYILWIWFTIVSILLELVGLCLYTFFFPFQSYQDGDKNLWRRKHRNLMKGLDIRLKTVVLNKYYRGIKSQVNFATFFVLNAKMLESMTFECERYNVTNTFLAEQRQLLQLEKMCSVLFCYRKMWPRLYAY